MGRVSISSNRIIPRTNPRVYLNGRLRPDIEVDNIQTFWGMNPSLCTLYVPRYYYETNQGEFDAAKVVIKAGQGVGNPNKVIFRGYVDVDARTEGQRGSDIALIARSIISKLYGLFVGQQQGLSQVSYRRNDIYGNWNGRTLADIIRDLFLSENIPSDWRAEFELGDIRALSRAEQNMITPDVLFSNQTYAQALRYILDLAPNISCAERYTNNKTYLDFFLRANPYSPSSILRAPTSEIGPEEGAISISIKQSRDTGRLYNRVRGYGSGYYMQLTASTDHSYVDGGQIIPAWNNATTYFNILALNNTLTADEQAVIANPKIATPGTEEFDPKYQYIFRLFRLPQPLLNKIYTSENALITNDGEGNMKNLPLQFIEEYRKEEDFTVVNDGTTDKSGGSPTGKRLVDGVVLSADGYILFPKPMVHVWNYLTKTAATKQQAIEYIRSQIYATITIKSQIPLAYDSGRRGSLDWDGIDQSGVTFQFVNNNLKYTQLGTESNQLSDFNGITYTYPCLYYDEATESFTSNILGTPIVIEDDTRFLSALCERVLLEQSHVPTEVEITIPGIWNGYRAGQVIKVLNRGIDSKNLQISQVLLSLNTMDTILKATDGIPRFISQLASGIEGNRQSFSGMPLGSASSGSRDSMSLASRLPMGETPYKELAYGPEDPTDSSYYLPGETPGALEPGWMNPPSLPELMKDYEPYDGSRFFGGPLGNKMNPKDVFGYDPRKVNSDNRTYIEPDESISPPTFWGKKGVM